jgi:hypothetical protein
VRAVHFITEHLVSLDIPYKEMSCSGWSILRYHNPILLVSFRLAQSYKRDLLNEKEINRLKPFVDELAPKLNAYLKSIGKIPDKTTDN